MSFKAAASSRARVVQNEEDYSDIDASDSLESSLDAIAPQELTIRTETESDQEQRSSEVKAPPLRTLFEKNVVDSDEERELRLLVSSSLFVDDIVSENGDSPRLASPHVDAAASSNLESSLDLDALDASVDEAAVQAMNAAIDAALNATYDGDSDNVSHGVSFDSAAELESSKAPALATPAGKGEGTVGHLFSSGNFKPDASADAYSDMDSDVSEEATQYDIASKITINPSSPAERPPVPKQVSIPTYSQTQTQTQIQTQARRLPPPLPLPIPQPAANIFHPSASLGSPKRSEALLAPASRSSTNIAAAYREGEAAYSDMSSAGDSDEDELGAAANSLHFPAGPQLRSLDMLPLARRDRDEVLVGGRNQDYLGLAYQYKLQRPYADRNAHPPCVLCHKAPSVHVFFPCEHRCVCPTCMRTERFCEEQHLTSGGYCMCPLCATSIKRILPHEGGAEVAAYWAWVEEISPALPPGFKRSFEHSSKILHAMHVEKKEMSYDPESICRSS